MQERTRTALQETLYQDLQQKNSQFYTDPNQPSSPNSVKTEAVGLFDTFKRAISGKVNK